MFWWWVGARWWVCARAVVVRLIPPPVPPTPTPLPGILPPGVLSGEGASWARLDGAGMAAGGGVSSADGIGCVGLADGTPGRPLRGGPSKGVGLADPLRAVRLGPVPSVLLRVPMA